MPATPIAEPGTRAGYPVVTRAEAAALVRALEALRAIERRAGRDFSHEEPLQARWTAFLDRSAHHAGAAVWQVLADAAIYLESPQARAALRRDDERA